MINVTMYSPGMSSGGDHWKKVVLLEFAPMPSIGRTFSWTIAWPPLRLSRVSRALRALRALRRYGLHGLYALYRLYGLYGPYGPYGLYGLYGPYGPYGLYGYRRMERFERTQQFHNRKWNSLDLSGTDLERVWNRDWNETTLSSTYVVTSSVSKLQNIPDTLQHLLQVTCQMFLIRCNIFCAWLARRSWYL